MNWSEPYTQETSKFDRILQKTKELKCTDIHLSTKLLPALRVDKKLLEFEELI